jgi:hypothetical protein
MNLKSKKGPDYLLGTWVNLGLVPDASMQYGAEDNHHLFLSRRKPLGKALKKS